MLIYSNLLLFSSLLFYLGDASRTMSLRMHRRDRNVIVRRDAVPVDIGNAQAVSGLGLYYVNATVGTPPQEVELQIDTGSSDVWFFGPDSCDTQTSPCLGGIFDPSKSSSLTVLGAGAFSIQYVTANSGVTGDFIEDDFTIGGVTISNLTMAVATEAQHVPTGIMGIGFSSGESIVSQGGMAYPNIIDVMVSEGIIGTKAYSLYLDDKNDASGIVLFGGYDTEKYTGDLEVLSIQPDAQSGDISSMTVAWTSLSLTDSSGSTDIGTGDFPQAAILDSGTTLTYLPPDMFEELADYFGVVEDSTYGYVVACDISTYEGSLDFNFGDVVTISVTYDELALPATDSGGKQLTFEDGSDACSFGLNAASEDTPILFGDTFLRSAYVVYDLENQQIGLAQTNFESTKSNIVEIGGQANVGGVSSVASQVTVVQTATGKQIAPTILNTVSKTASKVQATRSSAKVQAGKTTSVTGKSTTTSMAASTTPTLKSSAARALVAPLYLTRVVAFGCTFTVVVLGSILVMFA